MPYTEVVRLLTCLEPFSDSSPVLLKDSGTQKIFVEASLLDTLGPGARDAVAAVIDFAVRAIRDASGAEAADEAERMLREWADREKHLSAGYLRDLLEQHRLGAKLLDSLESFSKTMPADTLASLKFKEMPLPVRAAIMEGVQKAAEMMETIAGLPEMGDGELRPDSKVLRLETVQKVQKTMAQAIHHWGAAILAALPFGASRRVQVSVLSAIHTLLQATKPKRLTAMLETLTMGVVADIFTMQSAVIREVKQFADQYPLPAGMDGLGPALRLSFLEDLLFESACRYIRVQKGISVPRLVEAEAKMLVSSDSRVAFGSLQRMYLNGLLEDLPDVSELRARANVKGFDVDGLHGDFVRDCIARRFSFSIKGFGKVENAVEREQAVAAGKRDMEFYETKKKELEENQQQPNGDSAQWERPEARFSASMTEEDLKKARATVIHAIPDPTLRMAVTALANATSLGLLAAFFGTDPGAGILFRGTHKAVAMLFSPDDGTLSVSAMLFHDGLKAMSRINDEPDELDLGRISFTQLEYTAQLKPKRKQSDKDPTRWRVSLVTVENIYPYFVPPSASPEEPENVS